MAGAEAGPFLHPSMPVDGGPSPPYILSLLPTIILTKMQAGEITSTCVIPAKHVPAKAGSGNPGTPSRQAALAFSMLRGAGGNQHGGFRVKHGMIYCMVITMTLY